MDLSSNSVGGGRDWQHWRGRFPYWEGLFAALGIQVPVLASLAAFVSARIVLSLFMATSTMTVGFWLLARTPPRARRGRLTVVLALWDDSADYGSACRELASEFSRELRAASQGHGVDILTLNEYHSSILRRLTSPTAIAKRHRGALYIVGRCRSGKVAGKPSVILDIESRILVRTGWALPASVVRAATGALRSAMPVRMIGPEGEVLGFEIAMGMVARGVRLVMGVAACLAGEYSHAETQFEGLLDDAADALTRSQKRACSEWLLLTFRAHLDSIYQQGHWRPDVLRSTEPLVARALRRGLSGENVATHRANVLFRLHRDIEQAKTVLRQSLKEAALPTSRL